MEEVAKAAARVVEMAEAARAVEEMAGEMAAARAVVKVVVRVVDRGVAMVEAAREVAARAVEARAAAARAAAVREAVAREAAMVEEVMVADWGVEVKEVAVKAAKRMCASGCACGPPWHPGRSGGIGSTCLAPVALACEDQS